MRRKNRKGHSVEKQETSSIIWKINRTIQLNKLKGYLIWDLIFAFLGWAGACIAMESRYGIPDPTLDRDFVYRNYIPDIWGRLLTWKYTVTYGETLITVECGKIALIALIIAACAFALQLFGWTFDWSAQNKKLRKLMRPIDEMAMAAEQLAIQGIDESRIQNLEEAIDQITASENSISMGDSDLQGLENAINNLLKRLQASYREQTRFVDDASHELRTPIAVIQGYASMLERWGMDDRETLEEAVRAISEESTHMKQLVDQLLFLARGDGGRQQLKMEEFNGVDLMKEVCEESEMIDPHHRYLLKVEGTGQIQTCGDYAMIKQAIRILTDNAAKYTPEGKRITFRVGKNEDGSVSFGVQDEGIGVEKKEADRLFERFFRGDEVRGNTKGSGLGLSIAKWIIDRHHGKIDVLSYPGVGTRMSIIIPGTVKE